MLVTALVAIGLLGLLIWPTVTPLLWVTLVGFGQGGLFALALTLVGLRSRSDTVTIRLSVFVQGLGYLLAAAGPFLTGLVHDLTGSWAWALAFVLATIVPILLSGFVAGGPGYVDKDTAAGEVVQRAEAAR